MNVKMEITFKTGEPIGQAAGATMWGMADYFVSVGPCTYLLKSRGEADSVEEAIEGCVAHVRAKLGQPGGWDVIVTRVAAEVTA